MGVVLPKVNLLTQLLIYLAQDELTLPLIYLAQGKLTLALIYLVCCHGDFLNDDGFIIIIRVVKEKIFS
jgi:hypothetical protein